MKYSMIATWKMSFNGLKESIQLLKNGNKATDAVVHTIHDVEANKAYHSVGYSGLPNEEGIIQCDAGYMDGNTLQIGAVGAIENIIHAVDVAQLVSKGRFNNVLVGEGANQFARYNGFVEEDLMTEETMKLYLERKNEDTELKSYDGHDTVGVIGLDIHGHMCAATSTSGLFMKKKGRVGDSPLVGSGFYCDDEIGACCATGVGEEILRGCLSYEVVRRMKDGVSAKDAANSVVSEWTGKMNKKKGYCDSVSLICMDNQGNIGVGTNIKFAFTYGNEFECKIQIAEPIGNELLIRDYDPKMDEID